MKKLLWVLFLVNLALQIHAQNLSSLHLSQNKIVDCSLQNTFTIEVTVGQSTVVNQLRGVSFTLSWTNPQILSNVKYGAGSFLGANQMIFGKNINNSTEVAFSSSTNAYSGSGTIAIFTFNLLNIPQESIEIIFTIKDISAIDGNGNDIILVPVVNNTKVTLLGDPTVKLRPSLINFYEPTLYLPQNINFLKSTSVNYNSLGGIEIPQNVVENWQTQKTTIPYSTRLLKTAKDWSVFDSPVQDQRKDCNSCWAFSTVALIENYLNQGKYPQLNLSEQVFVSCSESNQNVGNNCTNGWYGDAFKYAQRFGVPEESAYPYQDNDGSCSEQLTTPEYIAKVEFDTLIHWGNPAQGDTTIQRLKYLLRSGPVVVSFFIPQNFANYTSWGDSIYRYNNSTLIGRHSVLVVNYNDVKKTFKCKNSWGKSWGKNGYFYMDYNCTQNAVMFGAYPATIKKAYLITNQKTVLKNDSNINISIDSISISKPWLSMQYTKNQTVNVLDSLILYPYINDWKLSGKVKDSAEIKIYYNQKQSIKKLKIVANQTVCTHEDSAMTINITKTDFQKISVVSSLIESLEVYSIVNHRGYCVGKELLNSFSTYPIHIKACKDNPNTAWIDGFLDSTGINIKARIKGTAKKSLTLDPIPPVSKEVTYILNLFEPNNPKVFAKGKQTNLSLYADTLKIIVPKNCIKYDSSRCEILLSFNLINTFSSLKNMEIPLQYSSKDLQMKSINIKNGSGLGYKSSELYFSPISQFSQQMSGSINTGISNTSNLQTYFSFKGIQALDVFNQPIITFGDSVILLINKKCSNDINDKNSENKISVYPNPAKNMVNITVSQNENQNLNIFNAQGQLIYTIQHHENIQNIDISNWKTGLYFIRYQNHVLKFLKE